MRKVSEILEMALNHMEKSKSSSIPWKPHNGMCVLLSHLHVEDRITEEELNSACKEIHMQRVGTKTHGRAYLLSSLRTQVSPLIENIDEEVNLLWYKWYNDFITQLKKRGE